MEYGELAEVPVAGVPLSTPVAVLNVTPLGSAPFSLNAGAGKPEAVTVKVPGVPLSKCRDVGAGDDGHLGHSKREALRPIRRHTVVRDEGYGVSASGTRRRGAAQHAGRRVQGHPVWQRSSLAETHSCREPRGRYRE